MQATIPLSSIFTHSHAPSRGAGCELGAAGIAQHHALAALLTSQLLLEALMMS